MRNPRKRREYMKFFYPIAVIGALFFLLLFSGCTGNSPPVPADTTVPTTATAIQSLTPTTIVTITPTVVPYPNALALNQYATFGSADMIGQATVYRYDIKPNYNWTSPSFNSPREQSAASPPLDLQNGFNMETPREGNTFLFIYIRVQNTGKKAVYAPSARQFVVFSDGKAYNYSSVHSSDVVIDKVSGTQYDYQIGEGGTVGYIQPGGSNTADGYLIYELPATFSPDATYVVCNLDYQNSVEWKLG